LTHFSRHSADELQAALGDLRSAGMKALVLDLRTNPGGLLSQATEVADLFVEKGTIVSTKGRNSRERVWTAKKEGTFSGFPMAVLVSRFSASASEIVSACLQDHKRAVIVGERTWGKGSVQNVIELEDGGSALKLTTASYHRPSGKNIHRFPDAKKTDEYGVMPDDGFKVPFSDAEMDQYLKYRHGRDVLRKEGPPKSEFKDRQLEKALSYVRDQLHAEKKAEKKKAEDAKDPEPAKAEKPKEAQVTPRKQPAEVPGISEIPRIWMLAG
jgi:carboxyl-terminal processing protease